jgi:SAM-dependent methyltransferase
LSNVVVMLEKARSGMTTTSPKASTPTCGLPLGTDVQAASRSSSDLDNQGDSSRSSRSCNDVDSDRTMMITQTLGGISYSLRKSPTRTWAHSILQVTKTVIVLPLALPLSILASLLFTIRPIQECFLGIMIPRIMDRVGTEFQTERSILLQGLHGRVLDLGSGGGAYLDYCQDADEVVAVEPVTSMHSKIAARGVKNSLRSLTIVQSLGDVPGCRTSSSSGPDGMSLSSSSSFDWIILGNVLCEVPTVSTTLHQVHRLLKPGGHVYFSEHIAQPKGTWQRCFQELINPFWRHVAGGCNCNHDSLDAIYKCSSSGKQGWDVVSWMYPHMSVCLGPFVLGLAQKKTTTL